MKKSRINLVTNARRLRNSTSLNFVKRLQKRTFRKELQGVERNESVCIKAFALNHFCRQMSQLRLWQAVKVKNINLSTRP